MEDRSPPTGGTPPPRPRDRASSGSAERIEALYIHVPFCHSICPFCAFAVHGDKPALHGPYLEALAREAAMRAAALERGLAPLRSVYVGGGTPSTLPPREVETLLDAVTSRMPLAPGAELSLELNPEDATPAYLSALAGLGINRLSLGLQSLDDATLSALGRNNDRALGLSALRALQDGPIENFNVDLIYGAPRMPPAAFHEDLQRLAGAAVPHLSLYGLEVEGGTLFARNAAVRQWHAAHPEVQAEAFLRAVETLTARGYRHYEVSNFARPGREGRQNLIVWDGGAYLGLGPGAFSTVGGRRWRNARHLRAWMARVEAGDDPADFTEDPTPRQRADEALMLALRRDSGLDVPAWESAHGRAWGAAREALCARLAREGKAVWTEGRLTLTPAGLLLADEITAALSMAGAPGENP